MKVVMRTFLAVAALVAVADTKPDKKLAMLLKSIHSFHGENPDAVEFPPGAFGRLKSSAVAVRLNDGAYCREMVAFEDNKMFLLPSGLEIDCQTNLCLEAWKQLPALQVTDDKVEVRCLFPQRALKANARPSFVTKWRSIAGTNFFVRLELPRAGLPCVAFNCADRSVCKKGFPSKVHMCTDGDPSTLTVGEIFAIVVNTMRRRHVEGASGSNALQQDAKAAESVPVAKVSASLGDHGPSGQRVDQGESPPQGVVFTPGQTRAPQKPPRTKQPPTPAEPVARTNQPTEKEPSKPQKPPRTKLPPTSTPAEKNPPVARNPPEEDNEPSEFLAAVLAVGPKAHQDELDSLIEELQIMAESGFT